MATPNDLLFPNQWNLTKIQAPSAWNLYPNCTGCQGAFASGVLVPTVDTGIDLNSLELADRTTGDPDVNGHGTHVAGIIAGRMNNFFGVAGVAFNSRIASYRACTPKCFDSDAIASIDAAVTLGAKVINISMGHREKSSAICEAVAKAIASGVVVVVSARNDGVMGLDYPAACDGRRTERTRAEVTAR